MVERVSGCAYNVWSCNNQIVQWILTQYSVTLCFIFIWLWFKFQGEQALFTYCCGGSFCPVSMVFGVIICNSRRYYCWAELWPVHHFPLLFWSFFGHHLFCSTTSNEEISCCSISYNCYGNFPFSFPVIVFYFF